MVYNNSNILYNNSNILFEISHRSDYSSIIQIWHECCYIDRFQNAATQSNNSYSKSQILHCSNLGRIMIWHLAKEPQRTCRIRSISTGRGYHSVPVNHVHMSTPTYQYPDMIVLWYASTPTCQHPDMPLPWHASTNKCQYPDMPVPWHASTMTCQYPDMPAPRHASTPTCQYSDTPVNRHASTPTCQYTNMRLPRHVSTPTCQYPDMPVNLSNELNRSVIAFW